MDESDDTADGVPDPDEGGEVLAPPFPLPEEGTPEFRAMVAAQMSSSVRVWDMWRAMLVRERPPENGMDDERLEELMWLHAGAAIGSLANLAQLDAAAGGDPPPEPRLPDLLLFVSEAIRQTFLDRRPPRFFRRSSRRRRGVLERNCIYFAEAYEELARETAPDGTRLLPDDNAARTIHGFYDLDARAYGAAKVSLTRDDRSAGQRWHPGAFRQRLLALPPDARLAYANEQIREAGHQCQWLRADRETTKPRRAVPPPRGPAGTVRRDEGKGKRKKQAG